MIIIVRTWIIAIGFCLFLFIIPLQCFIIGDYNGVGIQGAVFRWQITTEGTLLIPISHELTYVTSGVYSGKTALMVIFWMAGTIVLSLLTMISLMYWNHLPQKYLRFFVIGSIVAVVFYLASCIAQYGLLLHGPAGVSIPLGVILLLIFSGLLYSYRVFFFQDTFSN